jgi:hypothetical protein
VCYTASAVSSSTDLSCVLFCIAITKLPLLSVSARTLRVLTKSVGCNLRWQTRCRLVRHYVQINTQQRLKAVHIVIYQLRKKWMQKTVLNDVFELLVQIGAVSSESEFSKDWLCRSECYMRTLRFKRVKPSVGTLAICASKLQHYGRCMTATEQHTQLAKRFIELSEQCHKQINSDAVGWWQDEVRV